MLFNSYIFIFVYLPIVLLGFFFISKINPKLSKFWLISASFFFYGFWNPNFIFLLSLSILTNYNIGQLIRRCNKNAKSHILKIAIILNISLLFYFKYYNFFISSLNIIGLNLASAEIILPLGISFYTFTQIAYLVDVKRGEVEDFNLYDYILFVTWFPHLIAGPVIHHKQMMPQFSDKLSSILNFDSISLGTTMFSLGLFKKVIIADQLAIFANPVFKAAATGAHLQILEAWIGTLCYSFQIYFDFSGYSDMAIGLSRLFNIKLPINFNSPYKANNIIEFWRRWHVTLSTFLRDYLYIPLGGNRNGKFRRYVNLLLTMLIGGLWHGAGLNYIIWGGLHGIYLIINNIWTKLSFLKIESNKSLLYNINHYLCIFITFIFVCIAWIPFRSANLISTITIYKAMFGINGISLPNSLYNTFVNLKFYSIKFNGIMPISELNGNKAIALIIICFSIVWTLPNSQQFLSLYNPSHEKIPHYKGYKWKPNKLFGVVIGLLLGISILSISSISEFLYYQF